MQRLGPILAVDQCANKSRRHNDDCHQSFQHCARSIGMGMVNPWVRRIVLAEKRLSEARNVRDCSIAKIFVRECYDVLENKKRKSIEEREMPYVMVDIESDGPIPGDYSMVCFGA